MADLETHDMQGIILSGYLHLKRSAYLFLHIDDAAQAKVWLARIVPEVTSAKYEAGPDGKPKDPEWALNLAFTAEGVEVLLKAHPQLHNPGAVLKTFSQEFREGIAEEHRAARLGDTGADAPEHWIIGNPQTAAPERIHICLMLQARDQEALSTLCRKQRDELEGHGVRELKNLTQEGYLPLDRKEHFGFEDAISEPDIIGSPKKIKDEQSCVKPGEFILGYENEYDMLPATPAVQRRADRHGNLQDEAHAPEHPNEERPKDLGRNGTYMVFRLLHQDVAQWRRYFLAFPEDQRVLLEAKFVGRWPSGAPLVLHPHDDPFHGDTVGRGRLNNFCYSTTDAGGQACPIGAHIRRVNPRDSLGDDPQGSITSVNRHRILRRGALYGEKLEAGKTEDDGVPRGVFFLAVNTDFKRQFEFIQQTWINNPKFSGLYAEKDPILGSREEDGDTAENTLTIQGQPMRRRLIDLPQFVVVKGGAYFFLPGIAALSFLADVKNPHPQSMK